MSLDGAEERILNAAAALFAEHGYKSASTRAIASAAEVNEVTVFRRFGSKAGVLRALVARRADRQERIPPDDAVVRGDAKSTLRNMAKIEIRDAFADGALSLRLAFDARAVPEVRNALGTALPDTVRRFAEYLAQRQAEGALRPDLDPAILAESFYGLTSSLVMYRLATGTGGAPTGRDVERLADQATEIFWAGARGAPR